MKSSTDSKEIFVFVKCTAKYVFCNKGFKRGGGCEIKKKKSHDKGLERRKQKSIQSFFREEIYTTKALLKRK